MKAYLTTIGEKTTEIAAQQLENFGFDVVVLDGVEPWVDKYKRFIETALLDLDPNDGCLRMDADVILNKTIIEAVEKIAPDDLMAQWHCYDFYRNGVGVCSPVYYSRKALEIIYEDWFDLDLRRPEATAWRLQRINANVYTGADIVGMHGFFQDEAHLDRHLENKIERKQMEEYNFELAKDLRRIYADL